MAAASLNDWLSALSAGVSGIALVRFGIAFVDCDAAYFDPRPALARVFDRLLVEVVRVRPVVRAALTDAAVTVAALLALLTTPETTR